jgi:tRNA A-37 threonylcarbamoyl transferase component Bud32/tetratricopeptide (TPR) repeat protein
MTYESLAVSLQDRYVLERELGRGGMATVYLARDVRHQRRVALKVLRPELAASLGNERFIREIAISARLTHPHILSLHDSGEAGGYLYYAMPYVEGESLRQRLEREGQLPIPEVIAIVRSVANALTYAHREGVIHRDIKPENILLSAAETSGAPAHPLVADFGIARALDVAGGERLTETGLALGTPAYMSPEQSAPGSRLDGRTDIYALGCVAYEMLAGAPPFTGPTAQSILARHAVDPVPRLHTVRATVPEGVEYAINRALAKVPADRFTTPDDFATALTQRSHHPLLRARTEFRRAILIAFGTVGVAVGLGLLVRRATADLPVTPAVAAMAVLPFRAPAGDTALSRLGRDLATTVGASLNGVGGITTADPLRIVHQTNERPINSPADASALARRLGAKSTLLGTVVGIGNNVRLDLAVYDAANLAPLAQGLTITSHRDSLGALTDSVVWAVLRQVWQRGEPPSPSLSAVTTHSVRALRAFLDGEREIEKDNWEAAALAFGSAIAADSTFWLAYFRYALALSWKEQELDPQLLDKLKRHRVALPDRDRMLVEAWVADSESIPFQIERHREVTQRFPDYWPGWFLLGDRIYHVGPLFGYQLRESKAAFGRAVDLNPRLKPAWLHLQGFDVRHDTNDAGRSLTRLLSFPLTNPPGSEAAEDEMSLHQVWRLMNAVARSGGIISAQSRSLADSVARRWASLEATPGRRRTGGWDFMWFGFPAAQVDISNRALRTGIRVRHPGTMLRGIAWAWAERGAWDSALTFIRAAARAEPHPRDPAPTTPLDEYGMSVLGAWLGAIQSGEAVSRRPAAKAMILALDSGEPRTEAMGRLAWLDGVLAFAERDRNALGQARQDVRSIGHPRAGTIDRSLAAFDRALRGDRAGAGREMAELEWRCAASCDLDEEIVTPNIAIDRIAAAGWLLEAGDTTGAARLLLWHQTTVLASWPGSFSYAVTPLAYLMLARIEEGQENVRSALEHYNQFLRRYDSPMPKQRHLVEEARVAVARLAGQIDLNADR